jgi:hypothetical protein
VPYAKFGDPQSLNLYSYVENSPLDRVDANGHIWADPPLVAMEMGVATNGSGGLAAGGAPATTTTTGQAQNHGFWWNLGHALGYVQTEAEEKAEAAAYQQAKAKWEKAHPGQSYAWHLFNAQMGMTPMAGFSVEGEGAELLANANKLNHIFGRAAHNLDVLVSEFGSQEAAYSALQKATQQAVSQQGLTGVFETSVKVGSQTVTVRGAVVDGVAKIGTAFQ